MQFNRCMKCMNESAAYPCPHCGYSGKQQYDFALQQGSILNGKYVIGSMLGQGGFGITYVGWDLALDIKVALKEYYPSGAVSRTSATGQTLTWSTSKKAQELHKDGLQVFLNEARKMARVDDVQGVVRVREVFTANDTAYIAMDFAGGETLQSLLRKHGTMSWEQAKKIFLPVLETLSQVHKAGIIHRDLSPDNIIVSPDGSVKILDLGAAKDLSTNSSASSMLVARSGFSPLEQYTERGKSGPWTDVYAISATLYYALTGIVPTDSIERIKDDTIQWDLPSLRALPPQVLAALQKGMKVNRDDRFQSIQELLSELDPEADETLHEQAYQKARHMSSHAKTAAEWLAAESAFRRLAGYKDCDLLAEQCRAKAEKISASAKKKKTLMITLISAAAAAALGIGIGIAALTSGKSSAPPADTTQAPSSDFVLISSNRSDASVDAAVPDGTPSAPSQIDVAIGKNNGSDPKKLRSFRNTDDAIDFLLENDQANCLFFFGQSPMVISAQQLSRIRSVNNLSVRFFFDECCFAIHDNGIDSLFPNNEAGELVVNVKKESTELYEDFTVDVTVNGASVSQHSFWVDCYISQEPLDVILLNDYDCKDCKYTTIWNPPFDKYTTVDFWNVDMDMPITIRSLLVSKDAYSPEELIFKSQLFLDSGNDKEALMWTSFASSIGVPEAQFMIAEFYDKGLCGLEENPSAAFTLYTKLASDGYADAELIVADRYYNGIGITQNEEMAKSLYEKAASHGSDEAKQRLEEYFS